MSAGAAAGVSAAFGAPVGKNLRNHTSRVYTCTLLTMCLSCAGSLAAIKPTWLYAQTKTKKPVWKLSKALVLQGIGFAMYCQSAVLS